MHIRIGPDSLIRLKQSEDNNGMNKIGTVRQPAQWNPETSRQDSINQTFQTEMQGNVSISTFLNPVNLNKKKTQHCYLITRNAYTVKVKSENQ